MIAAPQGVGIISQTCDAVRATTVQVAPVVHLSGPGLSDAASGRSPKWAPLPDIADNVFIRLDTIATIDKSLLREENRIPGVTSPTAVRALAQAIGRRYSRFAFPDDVNEWFSPLKDVAQSKAPRAGSAEGRAFRRVRQIRVRSDNGWAAAPYDLGITFVLDEGEIPFVEELGDERGLEEWLQGKDANSIADRLDGGSPLEQERLWNALAEVWVGRCHDKSAPGAVRSFSVDVATADEYSLALVQASEALDLDHLSGPTLAS